MKEERGAKQMESVQASRAYQREWFQKAKEDVEGGAPFALAHADEIEEIFNVMEIPVQVVIPWNAIIHSKKMTQYYNKILAERGYDYAPARALTLAGGLACTMDNNPETAPWGGLPRPTIVIGSRTHVDFRVLELWAREYGCAFYPLQKDACLQPHPPRWWEKLRDHWDEEVDSKRLDFRVEQLKEVIHFLEITTGRTCDLVKLNTAMELLNEQMDYMGKARDLICETVPCPVSVRDQQGIYQAMWHRGTTKGRDLTKAFYEEVRYRVEKGIATNPKERLRIMWDEIGGVPPAWTQYVSEKYGAVVMAPLYPSIAREAYYRRVINNDPLRALASRNLMFFSVTPDWRLRDAKLCKCDGVVEIRARGVRSPVLQQSYIYENAGIPFLEIPRDSDDPDIRAMLDHFIETRLLPKKKAL